MKQARRFIFLSENFYHDYPESLYPEIEQKRLRPYIQVVTTIGDYQFAIPLRSNIKHPHVLWTDKANKCGLDFSKAVVIYKSIYIDTERTPHIRQNEFDALRGKDYRIKQKMIAYINKYKAAKTKSGDSVSAELVRKSTLQYFEDAIYGADEARGSN